MTNRDILLVVSWMTGALLYFSAMAIAVRAMSSSLSVFEIWMFRSGSVAALLLMLALLQPKFRPSLRIRRVPLQLMRNVLHFLGTAGWA